eukprot:TRINITY_DN3442_c0_g1_i5.p1 TRINITY_DN3442_c0_g1~~TRINITY_DN3442_c0_g1_i5.p1  ORF type:complete len:406 (-),score=91.23 TRINITY_DN3442_c0_g1_i5:290-1507(-)
MIFSHLPLKDISTCMRVNKSWNDSLQSSFLWFLLFSRDFVTKCGLQLHDPGLRITSLEQQSHLREKHENKRKTKLLRLQIAQKVEQSYDEGTGVGFDEVDDIIVESSESTAEDPEVLVDPEEIVETEEIQETEGATTNYLNTLLCAAQAKEIAKKAKEMALLGDSDSVASEEEDRLFPDWQAEYKLMRHVVRLFNQTSQPSTAILKLQEAGYIEDHVQLARFLFNGTKSKILSPQKVGEILTEATEDEIMMNAYFEQIGLTFDCFSFDFRLLLSVVGLPKANRKIDCILAPFSEFYFHQCIEKERFQTVFPNSLCVFWFSYSLLLLNTAIHHPSITAMTRDQFIASNRIFEIEYTQRNLEYPVDFFGEIFDDVSRFPFDNGGLPHRRLSKFALAKQNDDDEAIIN